MVPAFSLRNLQATHGRPKLLTARPRGPHRGSPAHGEAGGGHLAAALLLQTHPRLTQGLLPLPTATCVI